MLRKRRSGARRDAKPYPPVPEQAARIQAFCRVARDLGAVDAKVISPKDVITAAWVRWKCRYGCSEYGRHLSCPPYSPTPEMTRKVLDEYEAGILIRGGRTAPLREIGAELELKLFLAGYYKAFALLCGPCSLCGTCVVVSESRGVALEAGDVSGKADGKASPKRRLLVGGCRHPERARPAMEAAGIDVFATARAAGFPLEVISSAECKQNYYALVLVE